MSNPSLTQIKESIAFARKQAGLTQEEMSKALNISQPAYSYYETGDKPIPLEKITKIAEILSIPLNRLIGDLATEVSKEDSLKTICGDLNRIANALEKLLVLLEKSN